MSKILKSVPEKDINFLKELDNKSVVFTCPYAEIDIPQDYFDKGIAELIGKNVSLFGLFEIKVYEADPDEVDKDVSKIKYKTYFFKHKGTILSCPHSIIEKRNDLGEKYQTLVFKKGDEFIRSTLIVVDSKVASKMLDLMTLGYLPNVFPYEDIADYWTQVNTFNGIKISSMSQASIELIVSEVARDPKDPSRTFRSKLKDFPKTNRYAWKLINIRQIPRYTSVFASITSGDPKGNLISIISRQRNNGNNQKESPVEDAIL